MSLKLSPLVGHKYTLAIKLKLNKREKNRNIYLNKSLYIIVEDKVTDFIKKYKLIRDY